MYLGICYKSESWSFLDYFCDGQIQVARHKAENGENCESSKYRCQDVGYCHQNGLRVKVIAELQ